MNGIELAPSRVGKGVEALYRLRNLRCKGYSPADCARFTVNMEQEPLSAQYTEPAFSQYNEADEHKQFDTDEESKHSPPTQRTLELRCGDLFTAVDAMDADVVVCETKFPEVLFPRLCSFLRSFPIGVRLLTYEDLDPIYRASHQINPYTRFTTNHLNDRFYTTWATNFGYRFHIWTKTS